MSYSIRDIAQIIKGKWLQQAGRGQVAHLVLDTRKAFHASQSLFFAIPGKRWDGHRFVADAYRKGIRHFVVSRAVPAGKLKEANIIQVEDTLKALQLLVQHHRSRFDIPVVGITGSNGKTVVKEWLYQVLHPDYAVVRSPKSYNSQVGVPLSVWQMQKQHEVALFEAGISQPGEMKRLQPVIQPDIGIFTNIGMAHAEGFRDQKEKIDEKGLLFKDARQVIVRDKYPQVVNTLKAAGIPVFVWGNRKAADLQVTSNHRDKERQLVQLAYDGNSFEVNIPFPDEASFENALHVVALLCAWGYRPETITSRIGDLVPVAMRLEMKQGVNDSLIINDSYNADINGLSIALDYLQQQHKGLHKIVILSDMLQSGKEPKTLYTQVAKMLEQYGIDRFVGVGKDLHQCLDCFAMYDYQSDFYSSTRQFLSRLKLADIHHSAILVKGARRFAFEQVARRLEQSTHQAALYIHLDALAHNLHQYRQRLRPETCVMAMVKAFAYGSGSHEIAGTLAYHNVDYLGVAYTDEGIALREGGVQLPIMVMNPDFDHPETLLEYELEPEVYNFRGLVAFEATLHRQGTMREAGYPVHIKLDTGMHRLGFGERDLPQLAEALKHNKAIQLRSVFSHLAAADEPVADSFTRQQIKQFEVMADTLARETGSAFMRHILNSAGVLRFPEAQFDMIRLGIGLYGVDPAGQLDKLRQVGTLKAVITQLKQVPAGDSVGYGRSQVLKRDTRLATVNIGYADGIDMRLGNGKGYMLVHHQKAPLVGKVCMDMCMLDVTDVPDVGEGDEVIVFGQSLPVTTLAQLAGTIPYELLTGISTRIKRIYTYE